MQVSNGKMHYVLNEEHQKKIEAIIGEKLVPVSIEGKEACSTMNRKQRRYYAKLVRRGMDLDAAAVQAVEDFK